MLKFKCSSKAVLNNGIDFKAISLQISLVPRSFEEEEKKGLGMRLTAPEACHMISHYIWVWLVKWYISVTDIPRLSNSRFTILPYSPFRSLGMKPVPTIYKYGEPRPQKSQKMNDFVGANTEYWSTTRS